MADQNPTPNPAPTPIPGGALSFVDAYELAVRSGLRAARTVVDPDDAEDVAMDTGRKVWEEWKTHPEAFVSAQSVKAWASVVARRSALKLVNKGLSRFRRVNIDEMYAPGDTPVSGVQLRDAQDLARSVEAGGLAHTMAIALDGLTRRQYQIHCMARDEGLGMDAIAKALGISAQTVKNQMTRSNAALKRALDVWMFETAANTTRSGIPGGMATNAGGDR